MPDNAAPSFRGLRVASFESRRAQDMARLIERCGGRPHVSPSMRELPVADNGLVIDFAKELMTGGIDVVILMTGVGTRHFVEQAERHVARDRLLDALADVTTVVRGPKPMTVLRELGIQPSIRVPEPNTWREILTTLDRECPVANLVVGVQEYGQPNPSLTAGLEARGAEVAPLRVYEWGLPEEIGPLKENVRAVVAGERDVLLFTSANQVVNLMQVAGDLGLAGALRGSLGRAVVGSIGPTTSAMLRHWELPVDFEPEQNKMGHLVQEAARRASELLDRKAGLAVSLAPAEADSLVSEPGPWNEGPFMKACRGEPAEVTPVWLMRQAGRYMAEYRAVREKTTFLELCKNPQLCAEIMVTAVERLGVDAAIIFSDLLPILEPMGMELEFAPGEGPVIHNPIRDCDDVKRMVELESVDALHYVMETVQRTRADLPPQIPVIGFAGAPFTLASYAIEGGASRNYLHTKTLMYRDEGAFNGLLERLSRAVVRYLNAQIAAGAQAVQLFDSWVGCLGVDDYRRYVLPHVRAVAEGLVPGVPLIHFGTGNPQLLPAMAEAGGQVIGVDWRIRLDEAWKMVGPERGVQGNLDPLVLLADRAEIRRRAAEILQQAAGRPGHIFNLGHGVLPQTPVENVIALVDAVHEMSAKA